MHPTVTVTASPEQIVSGREKSLLVALSGEGTEQKHSESPQPPAGPLNLKGGALLWKNMIKAGKPNVSPGAPKLLRVPILLQRRVMHCAGLIQKR